MHPGPSKLTKTGVRRLKLVGTRRTNNALEGPVFRSRSAAFIEGTGYKSLVTNAAYDGEKGYAWLLHLFLSAVDIEYEHPEGGTTSGIHFGGQFGSVTKCHKIFLFISFSIDVNFTSGRKLQLRLESAKIPHQVLYILALRARYEGGGLDRRAVTSVAAARLSLTSRLSRA
ncbi:hypothetical protein K438DRAFT_1767040 [Mycena galopus ATCC 62051]|nr:hypothetical protein K438DRAFT_1767040 [Mycena galopus ATCC 62051]